MKLIHVSLSVVVAAAALTACSSSAPEPVPVAERATPAVQASTPPAPTPSPEQTTPTTPPPTTTAITAITATAEPSTPLRVPADPAVAAPSAASGPGESRAYTTAEVRGWLKDPVSAPGKLVFLTFDDGPNHDITPLVLDVLQSSGVHATFFVVGNAVPGAPDVLEREVAEGHRVALHSLTHDYAKLYPGRSANADRVAWEFDETMAAARAVLGEDFSTTAWRYPGGHESWKNLAASDAALEARGATWLDWNAMTGDAEPKKRRPTTVDAMVAKAVEPITQDVEVVVLLAHDSRGKELTVASLPRVIEAYKAAGYGFGTLS